MMASYVTLFVPSPLKKSQPHQKYQLQIDGTIVLITQVPTEGFSWHDDAVTATFLLTTRARYTHHKFSPLWKLTWTLLQILLPNIAPTTLTH